MFKRSAALAAVSVVVLGAAAGVATARQERGAPNVSLAQSVVAAASAFEHYTHYAGGISAGFRDGDGVASALRQGAAYKADQFEEGMIAYGAIAALQERAFVEGVRRAGHDVGPEVLAERLTARPDLVLQIDGAGSAAARAQAALLRQSAPLAAAGRAVKQSAYDIQRQGWSKDAVADSAGRLARVKAISATAFAPGEDDAGRLIQSATARQDVREGAASGVTPVTMRAAALAALAVLGAADEEETARLTPVLHDPKADSCMKMAKLNLYQCLAVAGPHYEDVFCLGQHAMMETAQCVSDAAGGARVSAVPPARSRGYSVPIASN